MLCARKFRSKRTSSYASVKLRCLPSSPSSRPQNKVVGTSAVGELVDPPLREATHPKNKVWCRRQSSSIERNQSGEGAPISCGRPVAVVLDGCATDWRSQGMRIPPGTPERDHTCPQAPDQARAPRAGSGGKLFSALRLLPRRLFDLHRDRANGHFACGHEGSQLPGWPEEMNGRATMNETAQVVVYSTPTCAQCGLTYRVMDSKGIEYSIVDLSTKKAAVEYVTEDLGYSQAPVVVASDKNHWSGFRPDKDPAAGSWQLAGGVNACPRPTCKSRPSYRRWASRPTRPEHFRPRAV